VQKIHESQHCVTEGRQDLRSAAGTDLLSSQYSSVQLLVDRWPQARDRNFPAGKEFRNAQDISISQGYSRREGCFTVGIAPQSTGAVDQDGMGIRINEQADLHPFRQTRCLTGS
jgi:hypothetical protein